jgi:DNA-binding beta-propeller fold protein YncE
MRRDVLRLTLPICSAGLLVALTFQPGAVAAVGSNQAHAPALAAPIEGATVRGFATPGARLWVKRYNGPGNGDDSAKAVGVSPDATKVYVTGSSLGSSSGTDYGTVAYDASTGSKVWVARYSGTGNSEDSPYALGVSPDGARVFVTGASCPSGCDYATVAYNASTGATLWAARYSKGFFADSLGVSPDGTKVFVTGIGPDSSGAEDYHTLAYNASTGARLWVARYNGPGNDIDEAYSLAVSPDGNKVLVTGRSLGVSSVTDYATVAYNAATGAKLWVARYNGTGNSEDDPSSVRVSPDGTKVFVTGVSAGSSTDGDYATVAYNASTGAKLWAKRYNGVKNDFDVARSLSVSPDGSTVFVTGESYESDGLDYTTIAYDATTGARDWIARYTGFINLAEALAVSPDGATVFVTGASYAYASSSAYDYATIAYDASTGTRLWAARYNGPGNKDDRAFSLAVSPDGAAVFVAGESTGIGSGLDYAVIAYSTG